jgi:hypothetical protein
MVAGLPQRARSSEKRRKTSFLKKRSKKLLALASGVEDKRGASVLPETGKSFLVLFFKKELLRWSFMLHD